MNRKYYIWGIVTGFLTTLLITVFAFYIYLLPPDIPLSKLQLRDAKNSIVNTELYIGKPTVVNFWATWCAPCVNELPDLLKAREALHGRVNFIFVSDETPEKGLSFTDKRNFSGNFFFNSFQLEKIGLKIRPTTYFYNEKGSLSEKHPGPVTYQMLINKYR